MKKEELLKKAQRVKAKHIAYSVPDMIPANNSNFQEGMLNRMDVLLEVLIDLRIMYNKGIDK